jgi:hypothetical protein
LGTLPTPKADLENIREHVYNVGRQKEKKQAEARFGLAKLKTYNAVCILCKIRIEY